MALDADTEIRKIRFSENSSGDLGISVPSTIISGEITVSLLRDDDFDKCEKEAEDEIKFGLKGDKRILFKVPNNLDDTYDNKINIKSERVSDNPDDAGLALTDHASASPSFHSTSLNPDSDNDNYSETDTISISASNGNFLFTTLKGRTNGGRDLDYQEYLKDGSTQYWDGRYPPRIVNQGQVIEFFDGDGDSDNVNAKITITGKDIRIVKEASITKLVIQKKGTGEKTIDNISDGREETVSFNINGGQKTFHKITWEGFEKSPKVDDDGSSTRRVLFGDNCSTVQGTDPDAVLSITSITGVTLVPPDDPPEEPEPPPGAPTLVITSSSDSLGIGDTANLTFTFDEDVSGFEENDIDIGGVGSIGSFSGSDDSYTATYTPPVDTNATVKIKVLGSSYTLASDTTVTGTKATKNISVNTVLPGAPGVVLSASPQNILKNGTSTITFDFTETVNFDTTEVTVDNGTLSSFSPASGFTDETTATLTPDTDYLGFINVSVPKESFVNQSGVSNTSRKTIGISVTEAPVAPSITITPDPNRLEGAGDTSTISINLSQDSTDFTFSDVYLDPDVGTLSGFTGLGDRYTVTYTPDVAQETDVNVKVDSGSFTNSEGTEGGAASAIIFVSNTPTPVTVYDGPDRCDTYGPWTPANYNPNAGCADSPSKDDGGDKDLILNKTGDHTVELDLKHFQGKLVTVDVSWSRQAAWENDFSFRVPKCSDIKEGGSLVSFTPYSSKTITKDNPAGPLNWRVYNIDGGSKIYFTSTSVPNAAPTRPIFEHQVSDPVIVTDPTTGQVTTTYTQSCVQIGTETVLDWPPCPEEVYITKTGYNTVQYVYSDGAKDGANDQYITVTLKATRDVLPSNRSISMDLGLQKHIWLDSTTNDDGNGEQGHSLYDYHYHSDLVRFRNPATGSSKTNLKSGGTQFSELVGHAGAKKPGEIDTAISAASGGVANLSS